MTLKKLKNRAIVGLDRIFFEQIEFAKATGVAGTSIADDGVRFIYAMLATSATAATFWRYDAWWGGWQQLATPPTTTITVGKIFFVESIGKQRSGQTFGSIFSFQSNATVSYLYRYDISTNAWSTLSIATVPAAFGTDVYCVFPEPRMNNYEGGYHTNALAQITTSSAASTGATSVPVSALPGALIADTVLDFGIAELTLTADAAIGTNVLSITAFARGIAAGTVFRSKNGIRVVTRTAYTAGSTTLDVYPIKKEIDSGQVIWRRIKAVLTAGAAASATTVTVSGLLVSLLSGDTGYYYDSIYMIGNAATQIYRYSISGNAWSTTSGNSGNPALPALPGACGAGCSIKWCPVFYVDRLYVIRGGGLTSICYFDLQANTTAAVTYYPNSETFTTGSSVAARSVDGKNATLLLYKDATNRWYEFNPLLLDVTPYAESWQYPDGTAVVGDRTCCMTTPDGVETLFFLQHGSGSFLKGVCLDA